MKYTTAALEHLPAIVRLLADDKLGAGRERVEDPLPEEYLHAFDKIQQQQGNSIIVALHDDIVVGCLQLTIIPGISRLGMTRGQIEGVRVDSRYRSQGIGESLVRHAVAEAKAMGCQLIQLTTDKDRKSAHHFYEKLGFVASHEGMKLTITD